MASAGHLAFTKKPNAITQRHPSSSHIIGDSAGYQIGTGALTEIKSWARHAREPELIAKLWRESTVLDKILRWLELHCDVATTVDMPLWARLQKSGKSPFQGCSVELLTELTVQNLRYFSDHRGLVGSCQFLNVLHFDTEAAEEHWYEMVRPYRFEGWATAGRAGGSLPFRRLLRRLLLLRDDGMLGGRYRWFHVLGKSQLVHAVAFTAIQRAVQKGSGSPFTLSFDSSTPILLAGERQRYMLPPVLGRTLDSWTFTDLEFPNGHAAATVDADQPFPPGSPLSDLLAVGDMNPRTSPYAAQTFDVFSFMALANHNCYVAIRAFIDANEIVFGARSSAPQEIADLIGAIGDLFECEEWARHLQAMTTSTILSRLR
jgi:hypothetical protein